MKINNRYNGTIIGGIFTIASLLLSFTYIVPIFSVMLSGVAIEATMSFFLDDTGMATIVTLIIFVTISLVLALSFIRKTTRTSELGNDFVIAIMSVEFFLIHLLGFCIYCVITGNKSDGQLFFGVFTSYPISSFGFIIIGIMMDLVKSKQKKLI